MSQLQEYKCPSCGGGLEFSSDTQKMKCPYCSSEFQVDAVKEMQDIESQFHDDDINWQKHNSDQWAESEIQGMRVYSCDSCGGEIMCDETTASSSCPYCDSPVVMSGQFAGGDRPDFIIPFKLDKTAAMEQFKQHIKGYGKFIAKTFKDENKIEEIKGLYVPFWLFDTKASGQASYTGTKIRVWSDNDYDYVETRYFGIYREGGLEFVNVPADGSSQMADELMQSIEPFDMNEAVDFNTAYMAGYLADKYDVGVEESTEVANERIRTSLAYTLAGSANQNYDSIVTNKCTIQLHDGTSKYVFYPVWILNTTYKGENLQFAMNGQTGQFAGHIPFSWYEFIKWALIYWAGSAVIVYLIVALIMFI